MSRALPLAALLAAALASGACSSTAPSAARAQAHPMLGSNVAPREPTERPMWAKVLLYVPDRILDLGDVVSFDVHLGIGVLANVHATRAVQAGAGLRSVAGFGWHERRSLGFQYQGDAQFVLPAIGAEAGHVGTLGTSGLNGASEATAGLIEPTDMLYQDYRDYWAVGGQVTLLFVGVDFDLHPVQVADFAAGFVGVDFLRDDFAHTRSRTDQEWEAALSPVAPAGDAGFEDTGVEDAGLEGTGTLTEGAGEAGVPGEVVVAAADID